MILIFSKHSDSRFSRSREVNRADVPRESLGPTSGSMMLLDHPEPLIIQVELGKSDGRIQGQ